MSKTTIPYLIARGKFNDSPSITYDYMGSAEFEFGAITKSWERLGKSERHIFETLVINKKNKCLVVYAFAPMTLDWSQYEPYFQQLANHELQLKEWINFDEVVQGKTLIENDVVFCLETKELLYDTVEWVIQKRKMKNHE